MIVVGLTGSIGMGKSTVAAMFRAENVPVFDADAVVHMLQGSGGRLVAQIEAAFPASTGKDGVDRAKLGALVFGDDAALKRLEDIVHPAVAEERTAFLAENADARMIVFDIPLLFEKGGVSAVDAIVVVSAPPEIQRARVLGRPGMTPEKLDHVLARQMPDADKRARSDFVIETGTTLAATRARVREVISCLRAREGG